MSAEVREDDRIVARVVVHPADVEDGASGARAVAEDQAALRQVMELQDGASTVTAEFEGIDVQGVDPGAETELMRRHARRRAHVEGRRDDRARGSQGHDRTGAAAGAAVAVGGVADAEGAARQSGVEGGQARHVEHRAVRDRVRRVGADLDVDERGIAHAADGEVAAAVHDEAGDGRITAVEAHGDRAVDAEALTGADGDDVVSHRVAVTDHEAAEGGAAGGQIEGRDDGGTRDVAEVEHAAGVELTRGGDGDRAGAAEGDRAVAGHDVAGRHGVGVRAREDERAGVGDRAAADGAGGAVVADLHGRGRSDDGITGVGVRADERHLARVVEGEAGLLRAGAQHVLDGGAERRRRADVGEDGVRGGAAVADDLRSGDGADAGDEAGDGLAEAAEVEDAHGAVAAEGQGADGERVVRAEARRAVRDHRAAGVGVGAAELQDAAAGVTDGDLGIGSGFDEFAAEGDRTRAGERQGRRADGAVTDRLVRRGARGGERDERLALTVELERGARAGAAEDDGRGIGPGGGAADDERAVLDAGDAGIGVGAGEGQRAVGGHAADEVAGTVDGVGEGEVAGAADDERAVIDDDGGRRQEAGGGAVADLQDGSGSDRGRPLVDIGAREHEGARVDGEAAEAADDGGDGGRTGIVDLERTVDREDAGAADGTAVAEGQGLARGDIRAAVMTEGTRQRHVAAAEDGDRAAAIGDRGAGEAVRTVEGKDAADDADLTDGTTLPDLQRAGGDQGGKIRRSAREAKRARPGLEEVKLARAAVDDGAAEGVGARSDGDGQAGVADRAVEDHRRTDRRVGGESVQLGIVVVQAEATGRTRAEGELAEAVESVRGILDDRAGAVDDDVAGDRVGSAKDEVAAVDDDASRDGLGRLKGQRAGVDGDAAGEIITSIGEGGRSGAVLDDAGRAGDAVAAAEGVGERGVVDRQARGRDVALANDDRAGVGEVVEDDGVGRAVIGGRTARDEAEVGRTVARGRIRQMPDGVRGDAVDAVPADGVARDGDGELVGVAGDERAGLAAAEAGDRAHGEDREVGHRGREVGQVVRAVGERAAVDGGDGDGTRAAVGGQGADVQDRGGGAEVDVTEAERAEVAEGRAEDEVGDREVARGTVAGLDRAAVGDVDRAEERAGTAEDGVAGDVGRDVEAGVAAEGERAAVDVDRDRAGEGAGRPHREGARARLDELAGAGAVDGTAEGRVGTHGEFAVEAEEDRAARGARAFEGGDGLGRAVEVELRARDVREADDGAGREVAVGAGLDRAAVEGGLDGIGLGGIDRPHPCPALGERDGIDEVGGQRAVAGAGEDERAIDAVGALRVQRTGRAVEREHARVGTQGERAAVGRAEADGPGVGAGDVLQDRSRRGDGGERDAAVELEGRAGAGDEGSRRAEGGSVRDAEGACRDDRGAGVGVGVGESERTKAFLGDAGRAEVHRAADDDVAGAAEADGEARSGEGARKGERARVAADTGGRGGGDGARERVDAADVLEDARGGGETGAGDHERLGRADAAGDLEGRAGGDDRLAEGRTEAGGVAHVEGAREDLGDAGVTGAAGERKHAGAILIKGERAEGAVVDRAGERGVRRGVGGKDRAAGEEAGVGDDAAGAGERADRGVARAEDVEDAAVDGQRAVEARVTAERVGVGDAQRARVDGRAAGEGIGARERLGARAGLDEREVAGDLAGIGPITGEAAAVVGRHVDGERRKSARGVGHGRGLGRDARKRADGLVVTAQIQASRADGTEVDDRAGRERVVSAEGDDRLLIIEVVVIGRRRGGVGEPDVADAGGDHLAGGGGHGTGNIQRATIGAEETAGDGGVLDEEGAGQRAHARGGREEDGGLAADARGVPDVDRVRDGDALVELELAGADQVDDVGARAEGAGSFDAEDAARAADVDRAGEVVGRVLEDDHARTDLGEADVAGDLGADGEVRDGAGRPLVDDKVGAIARGDRAAVDSDGVRADGGADEDAAARDGEAGRGVEGDGAGGVEAERVDGDRRGADGRQDAAVDVGAGGVRRRVAGQGDDLAAADGGEADARVRGRPAAEDAGGVVGVAGRDTARAHARGLEVDAGTGDGAGDGAESEGQRGGAVEVARGARTAREKGRPVEILDVVGAGTLGLHQQRTAAELQGADRIDDRRRSRGQPAVIEVQRAAEDGGVARVARIVVRDEGESAAADLDEAADAGGADRTYAAPDLTREFRAVRAGDRQVEPIEVQDAARAVRLGARHDGRADRRDGDVAVELDDAACGVAEVEGLGGGGAVDAIADVERVGMVEQDGARAGAGAVVIGVAQVGVDAVETEDASTGLDEGTGGPVRTDALGEHDHIGVRGAVGVELGAAVDDDGGEVGRRRHVTRERIGGEARDTGGEAERRVGAHEGERAVAEDGPGVRDGREFDDAVGAVLADDRTADVGVTAGGQRIEDDATVAIVRRTAGQDDGGVAGDAVGKGQGRAAAAEAVGGLAVLDVREERDVIRDVLVGAEHEAGGVRGTEVERLVLGRGAEGDRTEGAVADLVDDGGLDAREARDDGAVGAELDDRRGTEVGFGVEAVTARADGVGARPTGVVGREIDRAVAPAAARGEVIVAEELGADRSEVACRTDGGVAHQVQGTAEVGVVA